MTGYFAILPSAPPTACRAHPCPAVITSADECLVSLATSVTAPPVELLDSWPQALAKLCEIYYLSITTLSLSLSRCRGGGGQLLYERANVCEVK